MAATLPNATDGDEPPPADPVRALTPRQAEVAVLIGKGYSYPDIASRLGRSARTIQGHAYQIAQLLPTVPQERRSPYRRIADWMQRRRGERGG